MSLNGIMINVSEAELEILQSAVHDLAQRRDVPYHKRLEIESLYTELCDNASSFNPETELAAKQQEQIQHLNAIIQNHENEARSYRELLRKSAIHYRHIGTMVVKHNPSKFSNNLEKSLREEAQEIALYLYNSTRM